MPKEKLEQRKRIIQLLDEGKDNNQIESCLIHDGMPVSRTIIEEVRRLGSMTLVKDKELYDRFEEKEDKHFLEVTEKFEKMQNEIETFKDAVAQMVKEKLIDEKKLTSHLRYYLALVEQMTKMFKLEFDRYTRLKSQIIGKQETRTSTLNVFQFNKYTVTYIGQLAREGKIKILDQALRNSIPDLEEKYVRDADDNGGHLAENGEETGRDGTENEGSS